MSTRDAIGDRQQVLAAKIWLILITVKRIARKGRNAISYMNIITTSHERSRCIHGWFLYDNQFR